LKLCWNQDSDDIRQLFAVAADAAQQGANATVMKANFGRARNYGERSIGYADAGCIILGMYVCCIQ
jgi:phosphoenolpyruvate---glycerone phosphotransferase subunit DhaL